MFKKKEQYAVSLAESRRMIGGNLSFAASEAYKLLRTNLTFSLPESGDCKIIGVTSSLRGEGKSTTSVNIAYTVAQTGKKVLLLECDLRLPTVAKRLKLQARPGISNLLAGQCGGGDVIQASGLLQNLMVISAGDVPPNPAELLGSEQMKSVMQALSKAFDFIVVDLPPANVVSDALIMSKLVSGMVLVVRQDFCEKADVDEALRQLKFVDAKILGFVMTGSSIQQKSYKRYGKYRKYGRYNHYGYYYRSEQQSKAEETGKEP